MNKILLFIVNCIDFTLRFFIQIITSLGLRKWVILIIRGTARALLFISHIIYFRLKIKGHSNIPKTGGAIIAPNHQSYLDPTLIGLSVWRKITFVSKKENFEIPILGPLIELGDAYPVVRGGDDEALNFFSDLLTKGHLVTIFPEGTIPGEEKVLRSDIESKTGLLKGKTGVIRLALKTRVPIIPAGISGTGKALPPEAIPHCKSLPIPRPAKIVVKFGKPIDLSPYYNTPITKELLRTLTDELMCKISTLIDHAHNVVPYTIPVIEEAYQRIRTYENLH